ncbi:MAG: hypothetical protein IKN39_01015, partial [Clostridia bacterium]|nr:hypothetical protein [Clostridia bacterium]
FILLFILGVVLEMIFDERKRLLRELEAAEDDELNAELEKSRKEFALRLINGEHKQETAELKAKLDRFKKQNDILKAVIEVERERREKAESFIKNDRR